MTTPNMIHGSDLFGTCLRDVERGEKPVRYLLEEPFALIDLRPGRFMMLGARPGAGKTAALLQIAVDLLRLNESVRLLVANVEMSGAMLCERIISRISGVQLTTIADRELTAEQLERVRYAVQAVAPIAARISFMGWPFTLEHVADCAKEFQANVLFLDYLQRFSMGTAKGDKREQLETMMPVIRRFCDLGACVIGVAAVARTRTATGSGYSALNLASFRGSSELEFGVDSAYILNRAEGAREALFTCEKNRYGEVVDISTNFDAKTQTFSAGKPRSGLEAFDDAKPAPSKKTKGN